MLKVQVSQLRERMHSILREAKEISGKEIKDMNRVGALVDEVKDYKERFYRIQKSLTLIMRYEQEERVRKGAKEKVKPIKIRRGIQYIRGNYRKSNLCLGEIALSVGMRKESFSRLWKKTIKESITDFINDLRIKDAEKMLSETTLYVSQIAYKVGFTPKYFSLLFKDKKGISPTQYRESIDLANNRPFVDCLK